MEAEGRQMLPVLTGYAKEFAPAERRGAIEHLFRSRGLLRSDLMHPPSDMFEHLFCGIPPDFGHAQFLVDPEKFGS